MAGPWEKYQAKKQQDGPWNKFRPQAPENAPEPVGTYRDGAIYKQPDGQLTFKSPGFSTNNQDQIMNMMEGMKPYTKDIGGLEGAARAGFQGATMGFGDEVVAAGAAAIDPLLKGSGGTFSDRYNSYLHNEREQVDQFRKTNPVTSLASEMAGGLVTTGGAASMGATALKGATTLPKMAFGGAVDGIGYGALAGAGYSEGGAENRGIGMLSGAAMGTALGGAAPAVMGGASRILGPVFTRKAGNPTRQAVSRLHGAIKKTGMTPEQIKARMDEIGPDAMLLDAMGEEGYSLARTAANYSPAARESLEKASSGRMSGQSERMTNALMGASGLDQPRTVQELQKLAQDKAQPAIRKAYEQARAAGQDIDMRNFDDILQADAASKAHTKAQTLSKDRFIAESAESGRVGDNFLGAGPSNFDVLDETKKSLDAMAERGIGQIRPTNEQDIAGKLARVLRSRIDDSLPEYGGARDLSRKLFQQEEAMALGAEGAKPTVAADFERRLMALDPEHAGDAAKGYAAAKIEKVLNRRTTPGAMDSLFGSVQQQKALEAALGVKAAQVNKQLGAERAFANTHRSLTGNSTTARQISDGNRIVNAGDTAGVMAAIAKKLSELTFSSVKARNEAKVAPVLAALMQRRQLPPEIPKSIPGDPETIRKIARLLAQQGGRRSCGEVITDGM